MRQLELLIVHARLRVEAHEGRGMRWNELPKRARLEVIEHLAELLRAKADASAAVHENVGADDE